MTMMSLSKLIPTVTITEYFEQQRLRVDAWLERLLPAESETPAEIHAAMRYSTMAGGKRLRPILTIAGEIWHPGMIDF